MFFWDSFDFNGLSDDMRKIIENYSKNNGFAIRTVTKYYTPKEKQEEKTTEKLSKKDKLSRLCEKMTKFVKDFTGEFDKDPMEILYKALGEKLGKQEMVYKWTREIPKNDGYYIAAYKDSCGHVNFYHVEVRNSICSLKSSTFLYLGPFQSVYDVLR